MSKRNADGGATGADDATENKPLPRPPGATSDENPPADDPPLADDPPSDAPGEEAKAPAAKRPTKRPANKSADQRSTAQRSPAKKTTPTRPTPTKSAASSSASGRPMTAADYARTTSTDPGATSVFPAVSDDRDPDPASTQPQAAVATESAPESAVTRQARLSLVHVDPWSVTQLAFVVSTALMIVAVVAVTVFWVVLNVTGVWDNLNDTINSVLSSEDGTFDVENYLGFGRVVGLTLVLSAINVVLMTALAAIGARLYNAATHLVGGIQVTFRDRG